MFESWPVFMLIFRAFFSSKLNFSGVFGRIVSIFLWLLSEISWLPSHEFFVVMLEKMMPLALRVCRLVEDFVCSNSGHFGKIIIGLHKTIILTTILHK